MSAPRVGLLKCRSCGLSYEPSRARLECDCGSPLEQGYNWSPLPPRPEPGVGSGVWRYREMLPVLDPANEISLGEGGTPLIPLTRLSERLGVEILLKDESANPTGTFKARGAAVAISRLRELGWNEVTVSTSGNGGSAFAAFAARAGMKLQVHIPPLPQLPAIGLVEPKVFGAELHRDTPVVLNNDPHNPGSVVTVSAFREPYRVEGDKTLFVEIVEQLGWQLPDHLLWPTGGAVALVAAAKALEEMRALSWIDASAEVCFIAAQQDGCAPLAVALRSGSDSVGVGRPNGLAPGVWVGDVYASGHVLDRLRSTTKVYGSIGNDRGVKQTIAEVAGNDGVFLCPEAALALSTLPGLIEEGVVRPGQRVVSVNTASGLRYPHLLQSWYGGEAQFSEAELANTTGGALE